MLGYACLLQPAVLFSTFRQYVSADILGLVGAHKNRINHPKGNEDNQASTIPERIKRRSIVDCHNQSESMIKNNLIDIPEVVECYRILSS